MHRAPPVSVRCAGGARWRCAQSLLPALAAAAFCGWAAGRLGSGEALTVATALAAAGAAALAGLWGWRRSRVAASLLAWDGVAWTLDGMPARPQVRIDLDGWLLLRVAPEPGPLRSRPWGPSLVRWTAVSAREAGGAWHGLRTALHARATAAVDGGRVPRAGA